jgi:hypothetical protein
MSKIKTIHQPSELYDAIVEYFSNALSQGDSPDVEVCGYQDFTPAKAANRQILLEMGEGENADMQNDGRIAQQFDLTLYAVICKAQKDAGLQAMNLASALAKRIHLNTWGWSSKAVNHPMKVQFRESFLIRSGDQHAGFEAWEISWQQNIMLGDPEVSKDILFPDLDPNTPIQAIYLSTDANSNNSEDFVDTTNSAEP